MSFIDYKKDYNNFEKVKKILLNRFLESNFFISKKQSKIYINKLKKNKNTKDINSYRNIKENHLNYYLDIIEEVSLENESIISINNVKITE